MLPHDANSGDFAISTENGWRQARSTFSMSQACLSAFSPWRRIMMRAGVARTALDQDRRNGTAERQLADNHEAFRSNRHNAEIMVCKRSALTGRPKAGRLKRCHVCFGSKRTSQHLRVCLFLRAGQTSVGAERPRASTQCHRACYAADAVYEACRVLSSVVANPSASSIASATSSGTA